MLMAALGPLLTRLFVFLYLSPRIGSEQACIAKNFGSDSNVCVCNSTYCDFIGEVGPSDQKPNTYLVFTSSKDGKRFQKERHPFIPKRKSHLKKFTMMYKDAVVLELDHNTTYQTVIGFGGAFTDSACINLFNLSSATQENLLKSYFTSDGIQYTMGRIPIGGSDFSTRPYTYNDDHDGDFNLTFWALQDEDLNCKIPMIQNAIKMSSEPITLFASAWSAPAWMKTSGKIHSNGSLKGEPGGPYYNAWAQHFVRFLNAYKEHDIHIWGLTTQNEPTDGMIPNFPFNAMGFTSFSERDFIKLSLGPALEKAGFGDVKLMMVDDNRLLLPEWAKEVLHDPDAAKYISGIAVHWYMNYFVPAEVLNLTHHTFPDKFILATEASEGWAPWDVQKVILGNWRRAENYANDIMEDLSNWVTGWVDWNMCLDRTGGPNWAKNFVDSPIIVDGNNDEFYKQPMYYAIGHYSKFIRPGSVRVAIRSDELPHRVGAVAFDGPDRSTSIVVLNRSDNPVNLAILDSNMAGLIEEIVPAHTIQTYIWWLKSE